MKFFFPDSQDQVDPSFDFVTEGRSTTRVRQRDDLYAHEALGGAPYHGVLVSKTIVDGTPTALEQLFDAATPPALPSRRTTLLPTR